MSRLKPVSYSWTDMLGCSDTIIEQMAGWIPDRVFGVHLGGIIPAVLVAKGLKQDDIGGMKIDNLGIPCPPETMKEERILIVDDIIDSGRTMKRLDEWYEYHYPEVEFRTAGFIYKSNCSIFKPDYYGLEDASNSWIVYPWEEEWQLKGLQ